MLGKHTYPVSPNKIYVIVYLLYSSTTISTRVNALISLLYIGSQNTLVLSYLKQIVKSRPDMLHCPVKYDDTMTNSSLVARNNLLYRFARLIFGPWEQIEPTYLLAKSMREKLIVLLRARK